jgi:hypothetical protein
MPMVPAIQLLLLLLLPPLDAGRRGVLLLHFVSPVYASVFCTHQHLQQARSTHPADSQRKHKWPLATWQISK